jgi:catechol 2,3-dioxygenase-like lactoylglutathione lyase family enzyme
MRSGKWQVMIMVKELNHTIVRVRDKRESATFLTDILGLSAPTSYGPFVVVELDNGVSLDFADDHGEVSPQHYAFLVGEEEFDEIFGRIRGRGLPYWADPGRRRAGEINHQRRWPGRLLGRPQRTLPGDHHAAVRQWRLTPSTRVSPNEPTVVELLSLIGKLAALGTQETTIATPPAGRRISTRPSICRSCTIRPLES